MAALGLLPGKSAVPAVPPSSPRRGPFGEEGMQSTSVEALELIAATSAPRPNRTPQVVAVVVGILIAVCLVVWSQLQSGPALPPPTPGAAVEAVKPVETAAPKPVVAVKPTAEVVKPTEAVVPTTAATPVPSPSPSPNAAWVPVVPTVKGPMPGARPPKGKASATPSAAPVAPVAPPPPPPDLPPAKAPEDKDSVNPYR
jgi:hypothetical protein